MRQKIAASLESVYAGPCIICPAGCSMYASTFILFMIKGIYVFYILYVLCYVLYAVCISGKIF